MKVALLREIVVCSRDTWFKYINMFSLHRKKFFYKKKKYQEGVRANRSNEIWHMDITEIQLKNKKKYYLQVIIDNYSRFVVNWRLSHSKREFDTLELLRKYYSIENNPEKLWMDQGSENTGREVHKLLLGRNIKRVVTKVATKYSNSLIEAFFRSLKNNFLYYYKYKSREDLEKAISFYIKEHNENIPHGTFEFKTPIEAYHGEARFSESDILAIKERAMAQRKKDNLNFMKCNKCLV